MKMYETPFDVCRSTSRFKIAACTEAPLRLRTGPAAAQQLERTAKDSSHEAARIQCGVRILEDHLQFRRGPRGAAVPVR
jgi:hypothetical protein